MIQIADKLFRTQTVNVVRKAIPIRNNYKIDLYKAHAALRDSIFKEFSFALKYEPETGMHALRIKMPSCCFSIFDNGKIIMTGMMPEKEQDKVIAFIWAFFVKKCVFCPNNNSYMILKR